MDFASCGLWKHSGLLGVSQTINQEMDVQPIVGSLCRTSF